MVVPVVVEFFGQVCPPLHFWVTVVIILPAPPDLGDGGNGLPVGSLGTVIVTVVRHAPQQTVQFVLVTV